MIGYFACNCFDFEERTEPSPVLCLNPKGSVSPIVLRKNHYLANKIVGQDREPSVLFDSIRYVLPSPQKFN